MRNPPAIKTDRGTWEPFPFLIDSGTEMTTMAAGKAKHQNLPMPKQPVSGLTFQGLEVRSGLLRARIPGMDATEYVFPCYFLGDPDAKPVRPRNLLGLTGVINPIRLIFDGTPSPVAQSVLEALRKLEPEQFLKDHDAGTMHPIIDGYVLPEEPIAAFAAGRQNDVPILIGSNSDEARPLIAGDQVKLATFAEDAGKAFGSNVVRSLAEEYLKIYPAKTDREAREARARFERDLRFGWDTWTWARMQAKAGRGKVFSYYFAHLPPYPPGSPFTDWGAGHWAELRYSFDHLSQESWAWTDADRALARMMTTYWTNFAKSGDPNGEGVPVWPNFTIDNERVLHFDGSATAVGVPNLEWLRRLDLRYTGLRGAAKAPEK